MPPEKKQSKQIDTMRPAHPLQFFSVIKYFHLIAKQSKSGKSKNLRFLVGFGAKPQAVTRKEPFNA